MVLVLLSVGLLMTPANAEPPCTDDACQDVMSVQTSSLLQATARRTTSAPTDQHGTFTLVRSDGCTPITAEFRTPVDDGCMRVRVADILANMARVIRYVPHDGSTGEREVAIGAIEVNGTVANSQNVDLTYECPPDGYNGFSRAAGSFCDVSPSTQLWATFMDSGTQNLRQVRVILSNTFPDARKLQLNEAPFGTALIDFGTNGMDLSVANAGSELAICNQKTVQPCAILPPISDLNVDITVEEYGWFGSDLLPQGYVIASPWFQHHDRRLLTGITTPSGTGGLQDFYFNDSGVFIHKFGGSEADSCTWSDHCNYECETGNFDGRFFDSLGLWNITWKLDQDLIDKSLSSGTPRVARAFLGNAIDGVGIFPSLMYVSEDGLKYIGLDKIGSAVVAQQPSYAYFWYDKITVGPPPESVLTVPKICTTEDN